MKVFSVAGERSRSKVACGLAAVLVLLSALVTPAEARRHRFRPAHTHHHHHHSHHNFHRRHVTRHAFHHRRHHVRHAAMRYEPSFSAMVVDGNSGRTLFARNEDALRHPASITKVMTLYLLFEQLERGRLRLDSQIPVSAHAAAQAPSRLGLRPGETIAVEDAIKVVVTKSANDIAVAIAEAVGGSEEEFAQLMTRKAHEIGMSRTHFANASGLPNNAQLTTAHDLIVLGRTIQERFPKYYGYFGAHAFTYAGESFRNHNHLLGRVEGVDGIKTGYTRGSGFNLLTSVKRDGQRLFSVVLGGKSASSRDAIMAGLIEDHIDESAQTRTAQVPVPQETAARDDEEEDTPAPAAKAPPVKIAAIKPVREEARVDPIVPVPVKVIAVTDRPRIAYVSGVIRKEEPTGAPGAQAALDGSTRTRAAQAGATTPPTMRWISGPLPVARAVEAKPKAAPAVIAHREPVAAEAPKPAHPGWVIQIGATDDAGKAGALLAKAKSQDQALAHALPYTEKVQKDGGTLYRARFANLEADTAEAACKSLKKSGFACFTTRN